MSLLKGFKEHPSRIGITIGLILLVIIAIYVVFNQRAP
jgi:hypothetical protein